MYIPSFEELKEVTDSRYRLVSLISKRARKIVEGQDPLIETKSIKPVSIAIKEVINGSVVFGEPMTDRAYSKKIQDEKERKLEIIRQEKIREIEEKMEYKTKVENEDN